MRLLAPPVFEFLEIRASLMIGPPPEGGTRFSVLPMGDGLDNFQKRGVQEMDSYWVERN
jgi:hypothetical protein